MYSIYKKNKKHFLNIFWSNVDTGLFSIKFFLISIIIIRLSDISLFGDFIFLYSILGLLTLVSISGIKQMILRVVAQEKEKTFIVATKYSFKFSLLGIPLLWIIGLIFYLFGNIHYGVILIISSFLFPFFSSLRTWEFYLKGKAHFKQLSFYNFFKTFFQISVVTLLVILNQNLIYIFLGFILIESIFNIALYFFISKKIKSSKIDSNWKKQSYTLTFMDFSYEIFGKADVLIIGIFHNPVIIGVYGVVMKFVGLIFSLIGSSIQGILPTFYKKKINFKYIILIPILLLFLAILFSMFTEPILNLIYGQEGLDAVKYINIYLFVLPIYFLSSISNRLLVKHILNKAMIINKSITICLVIILYFILIPKYGIMGGVISSIFYFLIQAVLNFFSLRNISI